MTAKKTPLSDLFRVGSSKRVLKSQWQSEGVAFYRGREVTRLAVDGYVKNELFISESLYQEFSSQHGVPSADDIMITAIGTVGNSYIVRKADRFYFKDASVLWLKKISDAHSKFVNYWLKSDQFFNQLDRGNGATVDTLTIQKLQSVVLDLPTPAEQRRIVAILDEAFEGIATAKAIAENNLKNACELFEGHREEVFSKIGNEWIDRPLSDICDIKHGHAFEGEFFAASGDYVLLTPGNFFEIGGYRDRGEKQKYFVGPLPSGYILKKDDLLLAMTEQAAGLLGSPLLVPESGRFLHNQRLGLLRPRQGVAWSNEFFFNIFNLKRVRAEIHASASGVKVRHTSPSKIGAVRVSFPVEIKTQTRIASSIVDFSQECDRLANIFECKLDALEELKKSLLHQAFTGQL